ncbi:pilus assembly protein TadG-related protein [Glaciihabitans tibetensis]|uniref:pilus assembly protein TadG-related protein n=1 Tax=Glaciihabitans tibetensis TaxID=1266600 RepID=UPI001FE910B5|nr:pilus assembly protein TadG-related protein [Glaciihabitans tibetensis]
MASALDQARPGTTYRTLPSFGDERGSMLPLTIFFGALSLVLVLLVVAASSLYLERKRLFTLADGAALVGAEAFELDDVALTADGPEIVLRSTAIETEVERYLAANTPGTLDAVELVYAGTGDGATASVELSAFWRPPVVSLLVPSGIRLEVTSTARAVMLR